MREKRGKVSGFFTVEGLSNGKSQQFQGVHFGKVVA
jgi:hypothetical protein